jgi:hypothetical protein
MSLFFKICVVMYYQPSFKTMNLLWERALYNCNLDLRCDRYLGTGKK